MSIDTVFKPTGSTVLIINVAAQVNPQGAQPGAGYSYRVRNLAAVAQYFTWGQNASVTSLTPGASPGVPNTIGMLGSSVEAFELPANAWFIASSATGFEFTFGQGA